MKSNELVEKWLKNNKVTKINTPSDFMFSKDNLNRSKKTYDENHQKKKVVITNNRGAVSSKKIEILLDDCALQTLKNYNLKDDEIDYYINKFIKVKICREYYFVEILRKEYVLTQAKRLNICYVDQIGNRYLICKLRKKKLYEFCECDKTRLY